MNRFNLWEKFNLYFFDITKRNWGFPYHILAGLITFQFFFAIFWKMNIIFAQASVFSFFIVNGIGLINEAFQHESRREVFEDILGNNIGVAIGFVLLLFIKIIGGF